MSLRDLLFDKVALWGNPFHGLVVGGILTLPDASTKTWAAITGGDCDVVRAPNTPAISRTSGQLAYDESLGHEWRDYSLISGTTRNFYKKHLGAGSWVYLPEYGLPFHIRMTSVLSASGTTSGGACSLRFTISPMGFTPAESTRQVDVAKTDIGQTQWNGADFTPTIVFATQSETGAKCLLAVKNGTMVIGWLELTTTGSTRDTISIAIAVKKTRAETIYKTGTGPGTVSSGSAGGPIYDFASSFTINFELKAFHLPVAGYIGEVAKFVKFVATYTHDEAYGASWGWDYEAGEETNPSSSGYFNISKYVEIYVDDEKIAWCGGAIEASGGGAAIPAVPTFTWVKRWTNYDETKTEETINSGPNGFNYSANNGSTAISDFLAIAESGLVSMVENMHAYSINTAPVGVLKLQDYLLEHSNSIKATGYKHAAIIFDASGWHVAGLVTPYGYIASPLSITSSTTLKASHQSETGEVSIHQSLDRCYV